MRRGLTTYTTLRAALTSCILCALLLGLVSVAAFPAVNLAVITLMLMPVYLIMTGMIAGFWPLGLCTLGTLVALYAAGGAQLMFFAALYLLPMIAVLIYGTSKRIHFWKVLGGITGAMSLSLIAIFLILQNMTGGQLYQTAANAAASFVETSPLGNLLLYSLVMTGQLQLPESMRETAVLYTAEGAFYFSAEAASELIKQTRSLVSDYLRAILPSLLTSGCMLNAVMGLGFGVHFGQRSRRRRAVRLNEPEQDIPDLDMPPLSRWHLPRPWGLRIGILGIGYLLIRISAVETVALVGTLIWQVFAVCYSLQGLAAIHYTQKMRGTSKFWRVALIIAAMTLSFMHTVLIIFGIFDQITDSRGLRPPLVPPTDREE